MDDRDRAPGPWKVATFLAGGLLTLGTWVYTGHVADEKQAIASHVSASDVAHKATEQRVQTLELRAAGIDAEQRSTKEKLEKIDKALDKIDEKLSELIQQGRRR